MSGIFGASQLFFSGAGDFYDFPISNSLRLNRGDSANLERTPSSEGNRRTNTISLWVKRSELGRTTRLFMATNNSSNARYTILEFNSTDTIRFYGGTEGTSALFNIQTNSLFRDVSAWYHIVAVMDTTQSTSSDRFELYVNGTKQTSLQTTTYGSQNAQYAWNDDIVHYINKDGSSLGNNYSSYYIAEVNFIDGQALSADSFGETKSGVWIPKQYTGSYGSNGFHLEFKDNSDIGKDTSGNNNHFTSSNLIAADVVSDSPTNNYATMNSLDGPTFSTAFGNLRVNGSSSNAGSIGSTFFPTTGKWYVEMVAEDMGNGMSVGIKSDTEGTFWKPTRGESVIYQSDGNKIIDGGSATSYGATYTVGDIIGIKMNLDDGEIEFLKNNVSQGNASTALTSGVAFGIFFLDTSSANNARSQFNFGQDSSFHNTVTSGSANASDANGHGNFYYSVPSGYLALNSDNLPEPSISPKNDDLPEDYFEANLWSGNGSSQSISSYEFSPDWVWIKERTSTSSHYVVDTVRGADLFIQTNSTVADTTNTDNLQSFDSDGFSLGDGGTTNQSGQDYVGWAWIAGGTPTATNSAGAGNAPTSGSVMINGSASTASLAGTIPATKLSANTKAGFSIVGYTGTGSAGATVAHGLSSAPDWIIVKNRDTSTNANWSVFHSGVDASAPEDFVMLLNLTNGRTDTNLQWNDTAPSATVVTLGSENDVNNNGDKHIMYCFHSVRGYSKFGRYEGNGNVDGVYVHLGFRPAFLIVKQFDASNRWVMFDNKRGSSNEADTTVTNNNPLEEKLELNPNDDTDEGTSGTDCFDFYSNGFKLRRSGDVFNGSGHDYIYMAFAEMPFKYANAR